MKIFVINPNTSDEMTEGIDASARAYAHPDTEITTVHSREGARSFESSYEEALSSQEVFRLVKQANDQKYDAIVIACFGDPHLRGCREISDIPVYGIAESSMLTACMLGRKFSIVAPREWMRPGLEDNVHHLGLETRLASVRIMDMPVLEVQDEHDSGAVIEAIAEASRKAIEEDGAEVILLGCSVLSGLDKTIEVKTGAPTLDGTVCAVKLAEAYYDYKLSHSKIKTYRTPDPQQWLGMEEFNI